MKSCSGSIVRGLLNFWIGSIINEPGRKQYRMKAMNYRYVSGVKFGEDGPVGHRDSHASREAEKFDGLSKGQSLSVRKACDRFFESRGLKPVPFGTFVLSKTRNKD